MEGIVINKMAQYFGSDAIRTNHALKVYGFCVAIAEGEKLQSKEAGNARIAAILHDIGIVEAERKHGSSAGFYQELEGPPVAKELLSGLPLPEEDLERVLFLIGHHHSYSKIDGIDFQILVEADFLVNIFEEGMKKDTVIGVGKKYFKTETGSMLLENMYLK